MLDSEVPQVQNQAALFDAGLQSGNFGGMFVQLVAQVSAGPCWQYTDDRPILLLCSVPAHRRSVCRQGSSVGAVSAVQLGSSSSASWKVLKGP